MGLGRLGDRAIGTARVPMAAALVAMALPVAACTGTGDGGDPVAAPLDSDLAAAVDAAVTDAATAAGEPLLTPDPEVYAALADALAAARDPRAGWVVVDLGQFVFRPEPAAGLITAASDLAEDEFAVRTWWKGLGDHLISADVAAPPGLLDWKRKLYGAADTTFLRFLDDDADVDWRHVSFGGVLPDDRPFGSPETCWCIPALDDPPAAPAAEVDWYPDHRLVFGIEVGGEHRAYPLHIMEAHELVNDTIGGRPISLTYCTLCRSAVAVLLDELPPGVERPVLRTSGLLQRSNKLVFDRVTYSLIDQFTGEALSGPLREAGVTLPRVTVVTSRWDEWRAAHPGTTLMAGKDGAGADYPLDPLGERDAAGPIFPVGGFPDDLRAIQRVVGVVPDPDGGGEPTIAFSVDDLAVAIEAGETVTHRGVTVVPDGSGYRLVDADGGELVSSEASWFAWIQRFGDTDLWPS